MSLTAFAQTKNFTYSAPDVSGSTVAVPSVNGAETTLNSLPFALYDAARAVPSQYVSAVNVYSSPKGVAFEGAKTVVLNVWNTITSAASLAFENVRTVVTNVISGVKSQIDTVRNTVSSVFSSVKNTISSTFDGVKSKVVSVFENVKTTISNAIEKIKSFFKFEWELPKIKLPHFSIMGKFSLNPPSIPTFSVQWYCQGGIMTRPTVFGINGNTAMVGGEAGAETILPLSQFWDRLLKILQSQPTPAVAGSTYNITVNVDGRGDNDDVLAEKVARRTVDLVDNIVISEIGTKDSGKQLKRSSSRAITQIVARKPDCSVNAPVWRQNIQLCGAH